MNRNLKLSILAVAALALPACIGGYQPGQDAPPVDNTNNGGGGGGGGGGSAGGGGTAGGGGGGRWRSGDDGEGSLHRQCRSDRHALQRRHLPRLGHVTTPTQFAYNMPSLYDNITGYSSRVLGSYDKAQATIISKITAGGHNGQTFTTDGHPEHRRLARQGAPGARRYRRHDRRA